jgi:hypothetical protein
VLRLRKISSCLSIFAPGQAPKEETLEPGKIESVSSFACGKGLDWRRKGRLNGGEIERKKGVLE